MRARPFTRLSSVGALAFAVLMLAANPALSEKPDWAGGGNGKGGGGGKTARPKAVTSISASISVSGATTALPYATISAPAAARPASPRRTTAVCRLAKQRSGPSDIHCRAM